MFSAHRRSKGAEQAGGAGIVAGPCSGLSLSSGLTLMQGQNEP